MTQRQAKRTVILIVVCFIWVVIGNVAISRQSDRPPKNRTIAVTLANSPVNYDVIKRRPSPPPIAARGYIVIESRSKYPLAAKNPDTPVPIASTTKIMTALVALDHLAPNDTIAMSASANATAGSKIDFFTGEVLTFNNYLYALLLHSANNAAVAIAEKLGGVEPFVAKMNQKAATMGLKNTRYFDPSGLDDRGHSTPRDLAILFEYALGNETLKTYFQTPTITIASTDGSRQHEIKNSNRLIRTDEPLFLANAIGGKTGFTFEAGHCLVASAQFGSRRYTAVVLNTHANTLDASAREARKLLAWAGTH